VKRYTSAPDPKQEDFCLPYFLKDEEKYVDLMAAVASILRAFPDVVTREHWESLNEAYQQIVRGPHPYEGYGTGIYPLNGIRDSFQLRANECIWCHTSVEEHR
jgi:hypothetical protein